MERVDQPITKLLALIKSLVDPVPGTVAAIETGLRARQSLRLQLKPRHSFRRQHDNSNSR